MSGIKKILRLSVRAVAEALSATTGGLPAKCGVIEECWQGVIRVICQKLPW